MSRNHPARILLTLLLLGSALLAAGFVPGGARPALAVAGPYVPDEVVVRVACPDDATVAFDYAAIIDAVNADYGTSTIRALSVTTGVFLLSTPAGEDAALTIARMGGDKRLDFVEPNYLSGAPEASPRKISVWGGYDDAPRFGQYAHAALGLPQAHALSAGAGVTVAVIDTGFQFDHPALSAKLLPNGYDFVDDDAIAEDVGDGRDDDGDGLVDEALGHGNHVAGIVLLVAPEARILPIRALNADGIGEVYAVAMAIEHAVEQGADVINLSLGTDLESDLLREVVQAATSAGILVVAASGNTGGERPEYPAADPCVVAVTSFDHQLRLAPEAAFGSWVDLAAPGEAIYSAMYDGGYGWWSGTSMATPFVSGQAALIKALRPDLGIRQLASLVAMTGHDLAGGDNPEPDSSAGAASPDAGSTAEGYGHTLRRIDVGLSMALAHLNRRVSTRWSFIPTSCTISAFTAEGLAPDEEAAP